MFNSEPTELERQREISSLRLKKVFGLSVEETRPGKFLNYLTGPRSFTFSVYHLTLVKLTFEVQHKQIPQNNVDVDC